MKRLRLLMIPLFACLLVACTPAAATPTVVADPDYWPTDAWRYATPEETGMDADLLAQMIEDVVAEDTNLHSLLVVRDGYVVADAYFHPYTAETTSHVQSVTKSVIGALVGIAVRDGLIGSVDDRLLDYEPGRLFQNPSDEKSDIQLKHLLSMSSGLDCAEFSGTTSMEESGNWVQYMLNLPMAAAPGEQFGYCNGNAHLLSDILTTVTGMSAREYANQELFAPLGIEPVDEGDWRGDPQRNTLAGYGLHLTTEDLARLGFLYLHNGQWDGQTILPEQWVANSVTEQIKKEDGSGYGYLWTVYPDENHYAALGLGGQQIHVYPAENLVVVTTAGLDSYAEAPEIEHLLDDYILPAIEAEEPLPENAAGVARLQAARKLATHPVQPVAELPDVALALSGREFTFDQNPMGWETMRFNFEQGSPVLQVTLNGQPLEIGLDNLYRQSPFPPAPDLLLRGHWAEDGSFVVEQPNPAGRLGELSEMAFRMVFDEGGMTVTAEDTIFGGEPIVVRSLEG